MSYIVHQKMPLRCFECPFCHTIGYFECILMNKDLRREHGINISRPDWCPLINIPTPHGRLIDADKLMVEIIDSDLDHLQRDDWKEVIQIISDIPTVIEAEESKTNDVH